MQYYTLTFHASTNMIHFFQAVETGDYIKTDLKKCAIVWSYSICLRTVSQ